VCNSCWQAVTGFALEIDTQLSLRNSEGVETKILSSHLFVLWACAMTLFLPDNIGNSLSINIYNQRFSTNVATSLNFVNTQESTLNTCDQIIYIVTDLNRHPEKFSLHDCANAGQQVTSSSSTTSAQTLIPEAAL
jgi:thioester reductase-like protein